VHPRPGVEIRSLAGDAPVRRMIAVSPRDAYRSPAVDAMLESLRGAAADFSA
jgi:hypothetical protein